MEDLVKLNNTLIVSGFREREVKLQILVQSFQKDGLITRVNLQKDYALVTFASTESALSALQRPHNYKAFDGKRKLILAPLGNNSTDPEHLRKLLHSNEEVIDCDQTILKLHEYCLTHIFSFLNLRELIVVEKVCVSFQIAARSIYRICRTLDFDKLASDEKFSRKEMNEIAQKVGPYVYTVIATKTSFFATDKCILTAIFNNCKKLKNIQLSGFNLQSAANFKELPQILESVNVLKLENCNLTDELSEIFLRNAKLVEELNLSRNMMKGRFLANMCKIRELNLNDCYYIKPEHFIKFCEMNPEVRSLDIFNCHTMNRACIEAIVNHLRKLESFAFRSSKCIADYAMITNLPNLMSLKIDLSDDVLFDRLAIINQLQYLDISDIHFRIHTMRPLASLRSLRVLKIYGIWMSVDGASLMQILPKPLLEELYIDRCNISNKDVAKFINSCPSLRLISLQNIIVTNDLIREILPHFTGTLKMIVSTGTEIGEQLESLRDEFPDFAQKIELVFMP